MAKALINRINVHYQIKGEGADVVLVHGITASLAMWFQGVFPLLAQDFRVTTYDLRGHGLSDLTPNGYTSREMAEDLLALMDHVGIERARIVGHSFGGSIGLHLALLRPERVDGVVLSDTGVAALRHLRNIEGWAGWKLFRRQMAKYGISYERFTAIDKSSDVTEVLRKSFEIPQQFGFRKGASRATPRLKRLLDETKVGSEFREIAGLTEERLPEITTPVLALYGETSPYRDIGAYLSTALPNCRHAAVPGSGHFYLMQRPDLFPEQILGFLRDPPGFVAREKCSTELETRGQKAGSSESGTSYKGRSIFRSFSSRQ